ncbi:MAG TPA: DUF4349 domain-containing protein [Actinomycetota bacterium]|nr:DUF4349 domain-containing protein [Actinomycetota bacterium]
MKSVRRMAVSLMVAGLALAACGGDDDAGIEVEEPIGAPQEGGAYDVTAGPSVSKAASIDLEVARDELGDAAQAVVDLATSPKVGGFLVSSIVDLDDEHGSGAIVVEVPSARFEQSVVELSAIGELTRQEMSGADVTPTAASTKEERASVRADVAYASIDVGLTARRPPPPPEKSPVERALATAKSISLAIASGAIVAAGAVLPVGAVALVLYVAWTRDARRLRVRFGA